MRNFVSMYVCHQDTCSLFEQPRIHLKYKHAQSAGRDGEAPPMLKGLIRPTEPRTTGNASDRSKHQSNEDSMSSSSALP